MANSRANWPLFAKTPSVHALESHVTSHLAHTCQALARQSTATTSFLKNEPELQALRFLRGYLQIIKYTPTAANRTSLTQSLKTTLSCFVKRLRDTPSAQQTHWFIDQLAQHIEQTLGLSNKQARKQMTMARDVCLLLEKSLIMSTQTESTTMQSRETSLLLSIPGNDRVKNYHQQSWFQAAKSKAGFAPDKASWFDCFFKYNSVRIADIGISAPPSARWLPLMSNAQQTDIYSRSKTNNTDHAHSSLIRLGTLVPYDIKNPTEQATIASENLYQLIKHYLALKISKYAVLYEFNENDSLTFYVNYQTLLSPILGESRLPHKDNAEHFVALTKQAMKDVAQHPRWQQKHPNVKLIFTHTNAAINNKANFAKHYSSDYVARVVKLKNTKMLFVELIITKLSKLNPNLKADDRANELKKLSYLQLLKTLTELPPSLSDTLKNELTLRARACQCLTALHNKTEQFRHLKAHQYNLMLAALEFHALGSQALALAGCKSGRDRTAIFLAAVKTMQENPKAMHDWPTLYRGIISDLENGHHFRAMHYHSSIVKTYLVHSEYYQVLNSKLQASISTLKKFGKILTSYASAYPARPTRSLWAWLFPPEPTHKSIALPPTEPRV